MNGFGRARLLAIAATALAAVIAQPQASASWKPGPPEYEFERRGNVPVEMSDGTVISADVYNPVDPADGTAAEGPFPVLLTRTPYNKWLTGGGTGVSTGPSLGAAFSPYLVKRGYIHVVTDVRGTGDSGGVFCLLCDREQQDGAEMIRWAARLPHSTGKVGTLGPSYLGMNQLHAAGRLGPNSPLKAMFPLIAPNDLYRDAIFDGGLLNSEFAPLILGVYLASSSLGPLTGLLDDPARFETVLGNLTGHQQAISSLFLDLALGVAAGGDKAYDGDFWRSRRPGKDLATIGKNRVPTYLVGGHYDLFQRGTPLNYSGLQNAAVGRPVDKPMRANQRVSGRYQVMIGPWYHLTAGQGVDMDKVKLAWFDRWLKGKRTGIAKTDTPMHLYVEGAGRWVQASRYPYEQARPRTYYLEAGRRLTRDRPDSANGADTLLFTGASSPCSLALDQWSMGALAAVLGSPSPCAGEDSTTGLGPGAHTYTTRPFKRARTLAGPIAARIYASSTRPDTELVATIEDVAPDGRSKPLSSGALLGSFRALDLRRTWTGPGGKPILPYHPYTKASAKPVPEGEVVRYDIEIRPTFAEIAPGHSLRLTLSTSDKPHLLETPHQLPNLIGGVYRVQRTAAHSSSLQVPTARSGVFGPSCRPDARCALAPKRQR